MSKATKGGGKMDENAAAAKAEAMAAAAMAKFG